MSHESSKFPWRRGNPLPSGRGAVNIRNLASRDRRLGYKARGLLTTIGSHRDGWVITAEHLAVESPDGIATVRSGPAQLEKYGYLRRYRLRGQTGKLRGTRWATPACTNEPTAPTPE